MSKKARIIISCFLAVIAFCAGIVSYIHAYGNRTEVANADSGSGYFVNAEGKIAIPVEPMAGTTVTKEEQEANRLRRGEEGNPFFILEIAPYEGEGQFAYLIEGCEPVDVELMCWNYANVYGEGSIYAQTTGTLYVWEKDYTTKYTGDKQEAYTTQYGTMKHVLDGSGNYNRTAEEYEYSPAPAGYTGTKYTYDSVNDVHVEDNVNGTLLRHVIGGTYEEATNGSYKWEPLSVKECLAIAADSAKEDEYKDNYHEGNEFKTYFENVKYYYRTDAKVLTHKNDFLRESIGLAYNVAADGTRERITDEAVIAERIRQYEVVVYTVTPEDLNANLELIDRADLITFATEDLDSSARNAYEYNNGDYLKEGVFSRASEVPRVKNKKGETFATHQLDWDTVIRIYDRVTNDKRPCPVLWDSQTHEDISTTDKRAVSNTVTVANGETKTLNSANCVENNLYKLYLMLYQMPTETLESLWGEPNSFASVSMGVSDKNGPLSTGVLSVYSSADANRYWNEFTLYPWSILPAPEPEKYKTMLDTMGIMSEGGLFNFGDGGAQNFLRNSVYRNDGGNWFRQQFMTASNVKNDQYGHEVYDFFAGINEPKTTVTSAECLYYLLNGLTRQTNLTSEEVYNVLELEPSPEYCPDDYLNTLVRLYGNTSKDPVITRMTTSEFIGKNVECIDEYDMIYIGMKKKADDPTMHTNFTYAHTGPKTVLEVSDANDTNRIMYGWLESGSDEIEKNFVYSGNDLTTVAQKKLKEFADSGAALMFGDGFFTDAGATSVVSSIDRNSCMYDLQKSISGKLYEKALSDSSHYVNAKYAFQNALAKARAVQMVMHERPKLYVEGASDAQKYINVGNGDDRNLNFRFTLNAPAGKSYTLKLHVDINGDGKYGTNEDIDVIVKKVGSSANVTNLSGGNTYTVERPVQDRVGSISWKLDILEAGVVKASESGVSAIKATAEETENLRILQVLPTGTGWPATVLLPQEGEVTDTYVDGEPTTQEDVTKLFHYYTQNINGMNIKFIRMTESQILEKLNSDEDYLLNGNDTEEGYDMLIIGFADMYDGVNDIRVFEAIKSFMAEGRAVLFTHDNSSLIGGYTWGKEFTTHFRDLFGMDRYDVLAYAGDSGQTRADYPFETTTAEQSPKQSVSVGSHGEYLLTQGISNGSIYRYDKQGGDYLCLITEKATQVNAGAITEYPYKIPPTIDTAQTHVQYYQLDYNRDDIVVWYCLSNSGDGYYQYTPNDVRNNYYIYNVKNVTYSGVGHNGILTRDEIRLFVNTFVAAYRATAIPVEVLIQNNDATKIAGEDTYYLCLDVDSSQAATAFGNDVHNDYQLTQAGGTALGEIKTDHQAKRVFFTIKNNNSYGDVEYALKLYVDETKSDIESGSATESPLAIFKKDGDVFMDQSEDEKKFKSNGEVYYVDVPIAVEETIDPITGATKYAVGTTNLTISIVMKYGDENNETQPTYTDVAIMPRGLFDLQ